MRKFTIVRMKRKKIIIKASVALKLNDGRIIRIKAFVNSRMALKLEIKEGE